MKKKKEFLKRGSGEIIGFIGISPFIVLMTAILLNMVYLSLAKQRLQYITYTACRAAVVSSEDMAYDNALKTAEENALIYSHFLDPEDIEVELKKPAGTLPRTVWDSNGGEEVTTWAKGNYCTCEIVAYAKVPYLFNNRRRIKCSITMAIEKSDMFSGGNYGGPG